MNFNLFILNILITFLLNDEKIRGILKENS